MDFVKLVIVLSGYVLMAPLLGSMLSRNRSAERAVLCLLVFVTAWDPGKLTLMVDSVEFYRGHTKGFEFSLMVALGISLTVSAAVRKPGGYRALPPGLWLYLLYCALSCLSLIPAANKVYGLMAAWKFTSASLIFIGAFQAYRDEEDLRWMLRAISCAIILEALVCMKLRVLEGRWQVHGWFEHQNPMAMWTYLLSIPLLAASFAPQIERRDTFLHIGAVGAAALIILLSVSRAGLAAFVIGSSIVTGFAHLRGLTLKKSLITGLGAAGALVAGSLALDSLLTRVQAEAVHADEEDLRSVLNRQSRAMLQDSAVGIGWNNFGVANSLPIEKYAALMMEWDETHGFRIYDDNYIACPLTESLYWLLLSETGYPGFISYIAFLLLTLWWGIRGLIRYWKTFTGYLIGGLLVALTITYLHGTVERVLTQTKNLSAWLVFAGVLARVEANRRQHVGFQPSLPPTPA